MKIYIWHQIKDIFEDNNITLDKLVILLTFVIVTLVIVRKEALAVADIAVFEHIGLFPRYVDLISWGWHDISPVTTPVLHMSSDERCLRRNHKIHQLGLKNLQSRNWVYFSPDWLISREPWLTPPFQNLALKSLYFGM